MSKRKTKESITKKVSQETGVEEKDLARLPTEALRQLDSLTPDEELLGQPQTEAQLPGSGDEVSEGCIGGITGEGQDANPVTDLPVGQIETSEVGYTSPDLPSSADIKVETADANPLPRSESDSMVIGEHPVTGAPVTIDNQ